MVSMEASLRVVTTISCLLSILGAGSIMASYFFFREMRHRSGRLLLVCLSVADLLSASSYLWAAIAAFDEQNGACEVQALTSMYFPVSSFLWTDCIAVFIFVFISNRDNLPFWVFHAVSWGIPVIQVAVVAAFGMEGFYGLGGTTGGWCWIRNVPSKSQEWLWIVIGGKGFEWASIIFTGAFYLLVYRLYRRRLRLLRSGAYALRADTDDEGPHSRRRVAATAASTTAASEFTVKLIAVPLVFFGARLFGNINVIRTLTATTPRTDIDTLDMLQAIFDPSQGFCNAIMFVVFSAQTRRLYKRMFVNTARAAANCFRTGKCTFPPPSRREETASIVYDSRGSPMLYGASFSSKVTATKGNADAGKLGGAPDTCLRPVSP